MLKIIFLLSFLFYQQAFAIVTIKPHDVGENPLGWSGELSFTWNSDRGNSETDTTEAGLYLQYDMNNSLVFLKGSYNYGESLGVKNIDKSFMHVRRIHKLFAHLDDEQFIQEQQDSFQSLQLRTLAGAGLRLHMGNPKKIGRLYFGLGAFYLTEKENNLAEANYGRGNFYISYKFAPQKDLTFSLVSYYQPRVDQKDDYLQLSTAELNIDFNKRFSVIFSVNYNINSLPALGVKPYDYSQKTALKYKF